MLKIGYARLSSLDQNLDRQIAALRAQSCNKIHREKVSGKEMRNRPELAKAIGCVADQRRARRRRVGVHYSTFRGWWASGGCPINPTPRAGVLVSQNASLVRLVSIPSAMA